MTDNPASKLPQSLPLKLYRFGSGPYIEASQIDRDTYNGILNKYAISEDAHKAGLFNALVSAEQLYSFEVRRLAQQVPSSKLKKSIEQIQVAAERLRSRLQAVEQEGPEFDALKYYFEMAAWKLMSNPQFRATNPMVTYDPSADVPIYEHPRIDQILPLVAYLERICEIASPLPSANLPGRKSNSPIRQMILPLQSYWTETLGRRTTSYKGSTDPITDFEQFLDDCTKQIAPGRWAEIKSAFTHP
jgi:hypothetical protein